MYKEMTAANINPLAGECPHQCSYCYVDAMKVRPASADKYSGKPRLHEKAMKPVKGGTRFLCSCNDLFADDVDFGLIQDILEWARDQDTVTWWIQTKNPEKMVTAIDWLGGKPDNFVLGITLETDKSTAEYSKAPQPQTRARTEGLREILDYVTVEPIMDMNPDVLSRMIYNLHPKFVNIGANSNPKVKLPEPKPHLIKLLIADLGHDGIDVRLKSNLQRLMEVPA
jgi:DNA repair photolyase